MTQNYVLTEEDEKLIHELLSTRDKYRSIAAEKRKQADELRIEAMEYENESVKISNRRLAEKFGVSEKAIERVNKQRNR